jgi:hypothetical protein
MGEFLHTIGTTVIPLIVLIVSALFALVYAFKLITYLERHSVKAKWVAKWDTLPIQVYAIFHNKNTAWALGVIGYMNTRSIPMPRYHSMYTWHIVIFGWHIIL